jgi:NitT/TauT family transport system permease protein
VTREAVTVEGVEPTSVAGLDAARRSTGETRSPGAVARGAIEVMLPPALALALLLLGWEAWVRLRDVPDYLLPAPSAIAAALEANPGRYLEGARVSLGHALGGLVLGSTAAFVLAVLMAHSRTLERAIYPIAILVKVTPVVAVAPLLIIWFGFGAAPKIVVAALITFFPMLVNAVTGLRSVDGAALDFFRALDAPSRRVLWKLRLPASLPYVMAALRISVPLSLIGAVVAEWMSGDGGMGQLILIDNGEFDTPGLFASIVVLAVLGVTLSGVVALAEHRLLHWHDSAQER